MQAPAALVAVPLVAGAAVGLTIAADASAAGGASLAALATHAAAAALLAMVAGVAAFLLEDEAGCAVAVVAGCAAAGLGLGLSAAAQAYAPPLLRYYDSLPAAAASAPLELTGVLREDAAPSAFGVTLVLDVAEAGVVGERASAVATAGGARVTVSGSLIGGAVLSWRAGRTVRVTAALRRPTAYLDPGSRDERRSLARRGIVLVGSVKSAALVEVVSLGSPAQEAAASVRAWARASLDRDVGRWSRRSAGVARAVLIGDRTGLSDEDTRRLQVAGTYHVIAISGGNIAILTVILLALCRVLRVPPRVAPAICAVLLLGYGAMVVPGASVSRAIAAAVLYLGARVLDHRAGSMNLLAVAASLGAAAAPVLVFDAGFLLSFGATLGILLLMPRLRSPGRRASTVRRAVHVCLALGCTTAAAEAALVPIGAVLFSRVTFCGLLLNFAAIPLMTALQVSALIALTLVTWPPLPSFAGWGAHLASEGILRSAALADRLPGLSPEVPAPAWWLVALYYAAAAGLLVGWRSRARPAFAVTGAAALAAIVLAPSWTAADTLSRPPGLRVVVLDVGQADATVVILPDGGALLVDAGTGAPASDDAGPPSGFDVGARVVVPALRALGVHRLEALLVTHGDPDHLGGARAVLRAMPSKSVWEGVPVPPHPGLMALRRAAAEAGSSWRTVRAGDVEAFGAVTVRVLHPPLPEWERQRVRNEDSVVVEIRLGDVAVVLPGDIGAEGEAAVRSLLTPAPLVVLKAPHHGSATSSSEALLDALAPAAVVFSAGRPSRYGHPAPVVVDRYRQRGVASFSTAEHGAVFIDTDGRSMTIHGWSGGHAEWSSLSRRRSTAGLPQHHLDLTRRSHHWRRSDRVDPWIAPSP